jgi:hypothetical protein
MARFHFRVFPDSPGATMSIEDPSLLSAYLDGSLDQAHGERMEAALREDAELRAELRSLAGLKDRLGRLSRPAAPDDSSDVIVGRVQEWARESRGLARIPRRLRPWLVLGPLSAAAAALLIFWVSATYDWTPGSRSLPRELRPNTPLSRIPGLAGTDRPGTNPDAPGLSAEPIRLAPVPMGVAGIDPVTDGLRQLRGLPMHLQPESTVVGTLTITAEPLSVDLLERIDGVIQRSPRVTPHHALFAALGRDRSGHNDARTRMVYAVPLDPSEYERLRKSLQEALRGTHACLAEDDVAAARLPGLAAVSRVTAGEVEPSSSIVPFVPATVIGDRFPNPNADEDPSARLRHEPETLEMIVDDVMLGSTDGDQHANRQLLREILGLDTGRAHAPLLDSTSIYLIRIVER